MHCRLGAGRRSSAHSSGWAARAHRQRGAENLAAQPPSQPRAYPHQQHCGTGLGRARPSCHRDRRPRPAECQCPRGPRAARLRQTGGRGRGRHRTFHPRRNSLGAATASCTVLGPQLRQLVSADAVHRPLAPNRLGNQQGNGSSRFEIVCWHRILPGSFWTLSGSCARLRCALRRGQCPPLLLRPP